MNYLELRKKYPEFIYKEYSYKIVGENLEVEYLFNVDDIVFKPKIIFKNISVQRFESLDSGVLDNLIFNLGLAEMPSYWKAFTSQKIIIEPGYLDDDQINWWHDLFINGMGQFFYENRLFENKIDFTSKDFLQIVSASNKKFKKDEGIIQNGILIPVGGGKDSAVTLELLKDLVNTTAFMINPTQASKDIVNVSGIKKVIEVVRIIDPQLLDLNKSGFLNGHTPFSSVVAFLSITAAYIYGYDEIALSNEQSSNEENTKYLGYKINHQYSKTFEFENKFRNYVRQYLINVHYFSFLRPLYEIQIAKIFSQMEKYFNFFRSCNVGQKTNSWCRNCSKCLSTFILLKPFVNNEELIKIFGDDLLNKPSLQSILSELVDPDKVKPFECVGTKEELKASIENNLTMLKNWNEDNNLPKEYAEILRKNI